MIGNIRTAFSEILNELDWMDEQTKDLAREKVKKYTSSGSPFYLQNVCNIRR